MSDVNITTDGNMAKKARMDNDSNKDGYRRFLERMIDGCLCPFFVTQEDVKELKVESLTWNELAEIAEDHLLQYNDSDACYMVTPECTDFTSGQFNRRIKIDVSDKRQRMASNMLARKYMNCINRDSIKG